MLYFLLIACSGPVDETQLADIENGENVENIEHGLQEEVSQEETELLTATKKDIAFNLFRKSQDNKVFFEVYFDEGIFRPEFVDEYRSQDLNEKKMMRMYVQEKGSNKKTYGKVIVSRANKVDFYPDEFLIENRPNQIFEIGLESSSLAVGNMEKERDGIKTTMSGLRVEPVQNQDWKGEYTTSKFEITSLYLSQYTNMKRTEFQLRTSYPIKKEDLRDRISIQVQEDPTGPETISIPTKNISIVEQDPLNHTISISHPELLPTRFLTVAVTDVPYEKDTTITASKSIRTQLKDSSNIDIYGPFLIENAQGFGLEYICNDHSVDKERWYSRYDIGFYEDISEHCALRKEDIEKHLTFDPPPNGDITIVEKRHGFLVLGDFHRGNLNVRLSEGVRSIDNGMIKKGKEKELHISKREPLIQFLSKGRYVPIEGWTKIPYRVRNTDSITMTVREIHESNLHHWMTEYDEGAESKNSDVVLKQVLEIESEIDKISTQKLDLGELLNKRTTGIYEIELRDGYNGVRDYLRVQVTNTALIAKRHETNGGRKIHVWAINNKTLETLPGTKISLHRPSGTKSESCITNNQGFCEMDVSSQSDNTEDFVLFAKRVSSDGQEEMTYLSFEDLQLQLSEYNVHGASGSSNTYRISAHTERGAYRPGDNIHAFALIRGKNNEAPKQNIPVYLDVMNARSQVVKQIKLQSNQAGVVETSIELPPKAATGAWTLRWQVGADKETRSKNTTSSTVRVENFVPERMNINLAFDQKQSLPSDTSAKGTINANYLFGSPAKDAKFEVVCRVESVVFQPKKNGNYSFGTADAFGNFELGRVKGTLDENGKGNFSCPSVSRLKDLPGMAKVTADVDVMEGGSGRSTHKTTSTIVHPQKHYIGLLIGAKRIGAGKQYPISGIVVDWEGNVIKDVSDVSIQKSQVEIGYSWYYDEEDFSYSHQQYKQEIPLLKETIPVKDGRFTYQIQGDANVREYRIRAESGRVVSLLDIEGERYYSSSDKYTTPDPMKPDMLDISVPKSITRTETVTVKTSVPYTGKILWTVEGDDVIHSEWMDVTPEKLKNEGVDGEISWRFDLKDMPYRNNIYVTAMLIKDPHLESPKAFFPSRALGIASIPIRDEKWSQKVTLSVPDEVRANQKLKVSLQVDAGKESLKDAVAMISVVDQGLLSLTNHPSPDPTNHLFPKLPLNVSTFETIGWSVATPSTGENVSAGGGENQVRRAKVVKPVALWSGIVPLSEDGKLDVDFDMPQYSGQVRVDVVTVSPKQFGTSKDTIFVRDPLTVQATLPRFMTKGDIVQIPALVTNLSGKDQDVELELRVRDGEKSDSDDKTQKVVKFLGASSTKINMKKDEQFTGVFRVEVLEEVGFAIFEVVAKAKNIESKDVLEVPFHSQKPVEREITQIQLSDILGASLEGTLDVSQELQGWSTSETQLLTVSHPYGKSFAHVKHLLRYPYGCAEQTSSGLRPLLTMKNMIEQVDPMLLEQAPGNTTDEKITDMVEHGISRLASMHNDGSGFAYWPGSYHVHPWATVYAMHVLLDAKKAGYSVNQEMLDDALDYMKRFVNDEYHDDSYYGSSTLAKAYMHYLLAREGNGRSNLILEELKNTSDVEAKYLLASALFLSGDRSYETMLKNVEAKYTTASNWRSFGSNERANGLILALHQELAIRENWPSSLGASLARTIASDLENIKNSYYFSTQEIAWMTYGLASRITESSSWKQPIVANKKSTIEPVRSNKTSAGWDIYDVARNNQQLTMRSGGSDSYVIISTEGVKNNGAYTYGGEGLKISRVYKTPDNKMVDWNNHHLGDEVVVVLTVQNKSGSELNELALVDHIPAGWEIQNPAFGRGGDFTDFYDENQWQTDYTDVQDSEIRAFGDIDRNKSIQFVYSIRATSAGSFFVPPVEIEAMYDHKIWARETGMNIEVKGPFEKDFL